jgi:hypothetical protein
MKSCYSYAQPRLLAWFFFFLFTASAGKAAVILTIDISNPSATVFSATGAFAQNNDIDSTFLNEGFTLLGFFNAPADGGPNYFDTSTLYSPGGSFAYTTLFVISISGTDLDLNIAGSGFSTQDFSVSEPALSGIAFADMTDWLPYLTVGKTGDILAGDLFYNTVTIGQYQVIPEPSTMSLLLASFVLLAGILRWRRA